MTAPAPIQTQRPDATEFAPYYARYIDRVPNGAIVPMLESQLASTLQLLRAIPTSLGEHRYAPGKWSVKETIGHVNDSERIFAYRALRIGRGDATPLAGFEQDPYIATAHFDGRELSDLIDEFTTVRAATISLFRGFGADALARRGTASENAVTTRALGFIILGHELHHMAILKERYL